MRPVIAIEALGELLEAGEISYAAVSDAVNRAANRRGWSAQFAAARADETLDQINDAAVPRDPDAAAILRVVRSEITRRAPAAEITHWAEWANAALGYPMTNDAAVQIAADEARRAVRRG